MTERELQDLLRQAAQQRETGLPADFSTAVLSRLGSQKGAGSVLPIFSAASALALILALGIAMWHPASPPDEGHCGLALFHSFPERAPFSAP